MKSWIAVVSIVMLVAGVALFGQSYSISPSTTLAGCQTPTAGTLVHCNVANDPNNPTGDYVSANGAAYFLISQAQAGGVSSWNKRTGAVVPATGDYSYSQLSSPPTTLSCATWSISQSGALTAANCTIK
jgi:hypothetical protein